LENQFHEKSNGVQPLTTQSVVWAEAENRYRPFRLFWNELARKDPTLMSLTLANAALWKRQTTQAGSVTSLGDGPVSHEYSDYPESMRYYTRSLNALSTALAGPAGGLGIGVVGSVLGLACHDVRYAPHAFGCCSC
jgi:hypothetical protein